MSFELNSIVLLKVLMFDEFMTFVQNNYRPTVGATSHPAQKYLKHLTKPSAAAVDFQIVTVCLGVLLLRDIFYSNSSLTVVRSNV